jgi:hypothetical protein
MAWAWPVLLVISTLAPAQEFPMFGPRQLGMGLAGVASVKDPAAIYANPAAMAREDARRWGLFLGGSVSTPFDLRETIDIVGDVLDTDLNNPFEVIQLPGLLSELNDNTVISGELYGLLAIPLPANFTVGFLVRPVYDDLLLADTVNLSADPNSPNYVANNVSRIAGQIAVYDELSLSWATGFSILDRRDLQVGATLIGGYAITYFQSETLLSLADGISSISDYFDLLRENRETSTYADLTLGAQWYFFNRKLAAGITGARLLSPRIQRGGPLGDYTLDPQVRVGLAWSPFYEKIEQDLPDYPPGKIRPTEIRNPLTLTFDADLTENESAVAFGIDSRRIGGGVEWAPTGSFALQGGASYNLAEPKLGTTITLGARIWVIEAAVGFAPDTDDLFHEFRVSLGTSFGF